MSLITTLEHSFAVAAGDAVKVARIVELVIVPVLQKASAEESTIESITALVSPQAAAIERTAFAVLGKVLQAINGVTVTADATGGVTVAMDAGLVADVKAVAGMLKLAPAAVTAALAPAGK